MIYPGAQQITAATVRNRGGVAVDPASIAFTVRSPAGAETTYSAQVADLPTAEIARTGAGVFELTWTPDAGGDWRIRCRTTGAVRQSVEVVVKVEHTGFRS